MKLFKYLLAGLCAAMACSGAMAQTVYGYVPDNADLSMLNAGGSGQNSTLEGAVKLDPAADPGLASLKGHHITGIRVYLHKESRFKSQKRTFCAIRPGSLSADTTASTFVNFKEGWNEVKLSSPVEIGDEPLYLCAQVYETISKPLPLASIKGIASEGMYYMRIERKEWTSYTDRGALMIQAVTDAPASATEGFVAAAASSAPLVVAPSKPFNCSVYLCNLSDQPVSNLTLTSSYADGSSTTTDVALDQPIAGKSSQILKQSLIAPPMEGESVPLSLSVSKVNGKEVSNGPALTTNLYVSSDAFVRVPLIEEFTSMFCTNCPRMFYYLDKALEQFDKPFVYVARHAGFMEDAFTLDCDKSLLYLFDGTTYNPAVMYDRRAKAGENTPVRGAKGTNMEQYSEALEEAVSYPALASLDVTYNVDGEKASAHVYGKIAKASLDVIDDLRIAVYLIENRIRISQKYPQWGLDELIKDPEAPADLQQVVRHEGVIRIDFTSADPMGLPIKVDADGSFDMEFPATLMPSDVNTKRIEAVAMIYKVNKNNRTDNEVLNAASSAHPGATSGIVSVKDGAELSAEVAFVAGADRVIRPLSTVAEMKVSDMAGRLHNAAAPLAPGIYIVSYRTAPGVAPRAVKIAVK